MRPYTQDVGDLFQGDTQYSVPPYQREYEWDRERWHSLWTDLGTLYRDWQRGPKLPKHFIGAAILENQGAKPGTSGGYLVIDGQQRMVTLLILLAAILHHQFECDGEDFPSDYGLFWPQDHRHIVLGPRLSVQHLDQESLDMAIAGEWRDWYSLQHTKKAFEANCILAAYVYFRYCLWIGEPSFSQGDPLEVPRYRAAHAGIVAEDLWQQAGDKAPTTADDAIHLPAGSALSTRDLYEVIMQRLEVLNIVIQAQDEDGPTIFETMNAKRTELEQWDLIRNSIFTRLPDTKRARIFAEAWDPAQTLLARVTYSNLRANPRDAFLYDYLIARGESRFQSTINRNRGHQHFMRRMNRLVGRSPGKVSLEKFITGDLLPATSAWACAVGNKDQVGEGHSARRPSDRALEARKTIMELSAGPPIPVMLHFIDAYARKEITKAELEKALVVLESYVARHVVCQTPMSPFRAAS